MSLGTKCSVCLVWKEDVVFTGVSPPGNTLREDFTFRHSFSPEVTKLLKASPGQVVILQPEKFRSKFEAASNSLTVKVPSFIPPAPGPWPPSACGVSERRDDECVVPDRTRRRCQRCRISSESTRFLWWATGNRATTLNATQRDRWWLCITASTSALTTGKVRRHAHLVFVCLCRPVTILFVLNLLFSDTVLEVQGAPGGEGLPRVHVRHR